MDTAKTPTAREIYNFRDETGYPLMVCKVALVAADGDADKARSLIRLRFRPKMSVQEFREAVSR